MKNHVRARIEGLSAYEIAVLEGFNGTEAEWLESLKVKGDTGPKGETGDTGNGIESVKKTSTDGIVDTYTITFTDGTKQTYELVNSIDTVPIDYTPRFNDNRYYVIAASRIDKVLPFTPVEDGYPSSYCDPSQITKCLAVKVRAGQMFKITAHTKGTTLVYAQGHESSIVREVITGNIDDFYYSIKQDGWIFVNALMAYENTYVKKVTIFDEVELNQKLLRQAIDSIPTVEKVRDAVLEALPTAEGGAY